MCAFVCKRFATELTVYFSGFIHVAVFQAEGYTDGDLTLYHTFSATAFLKADNPVDFLSKANEVRRIIQNFTMAVSIDGKLTCWLAKPHLATIEFLSLSRF